MVVTSFQTAALPQLIFGAGRYTELPSLIKRYGRRVLLVTGKRSFDAAEALLTAFEREGIEYDRVMISGEPSPADIDSAVQAYPLADVVVGIGGGAVIDAGKAISAMLPTQQPVKRFLEGVGDLRPSGEKVPYVACPTTAGTGAEVTKNAVITEVGPQGFKKSLRHDRYVPDAVLIDPILARSCPADVTAACGMDALTQLLEAFVSTQASVFTDTFARSGLASAARSLRRAVSHPDDLNARSDMAWAAYTSGVSLAHAGLGVVHGLASPIGGFYSIPHGVVCGTLLPSATAINVEWLAQHDPEGVAIAKHAEVAALFGCASRDPVEASHALVDVLAQLKRDLSIPDLSTWSVGAEPRILDKAGLKNNPAPLDRESIARLLVNAGALVGDRAEDR